MTNKNGREGRTPGLRLKKQSTHQSLHASHSIIGPSSFVLHKHHVSSFLGLPVLLFAFFLLGPA